MKKSVRLGISALIALVVLAVGFYVTLPALNVYNQEFWSFLLLGGAAFTAANVLLGRIKKNAPRKEEKNSKKGKLAAFFSDTASKISLVVLVLPIAILLVGNLLSSTFFNAEKYSSIITVEDRVFEDDLPENDVVTNIALMDSSSAAIIGNRTLGNLSYADLVSQFQVGENYSQINLKGAPEKVTSLEYADFFRWFNNRDKGVPGYVMVDPVNSDAEYIAFEKPLRYVDSAYFSEDLNRKLRFSFPTKIFGTVMFEIDEEGDPFYIVSCLSPKVGLFGALDVNEVIIFNPVDGSSELYALEDTPAWVDNVFDGYLASQKYDWYGTLKQGYWNSIIGKKDCRVTTDDFGYIILGDDVWYFTGVTSVSNDESNIGFLMSNARTGEYRFYAVTGAEEYSAMRVAEEEVADKGYTASFPSLINVSGNPTYIMVLKDDGGVVKLCALVNVENYSIVATGATQQEAKEAYLNILIQKGLVEKEEAPAPEDPAVKTSDATITVKDVRLANAEDGSSLVYIRDTGGTLYRCALSDDESVMLIADGDQITVTYSDTDTEKIKRLYSWKYTEAGE